MTRGNGDLPEEPAAPRQAKTKTRPRFQLVQAGPEVLRWRLLGGNNVSLGGSATGCAGPAGCLAGIAALKENLDRTSAEFRHVSGVRWRWVLSVDGVAVAEATHAYGRRIEARRGLDRFLLAAASATAGADIEIVADWRQKYRR